MIGVLVEEAERSAVAEFFELFKTPWEFYRDRSNYDILICSKSELPDSSAKLVLIYGCEENSFDRQRGNQILSQRPNRVLSYDGNRIPIYGNCLAFKNGGVH